MSRQFDCGSVRLRLLIGGVALPFVMFGCATYRSAQHDVERATRDWHRPRARVGGASSPGTLSPGTLSPESTAVETLPIASEIAARPVDRFIREALERNPGIEAAMSAARAKLERIPQVTSLPDPMIRSIVRPEPIQTAAGDVYFTLGVSQTFPALAKLERAGNIAAAETRAALEQLNVKRIQLIADVERAYWEMYRLDRYLDITRENRRILEDLEGVVDTRYRVGRVPQQDLLRTQTELGKLRDDEHRLVVRRSAAVAALNRLTNYPPYREIPITSRSDAAAVDAEVEQLVALAADHSPDLAALREQIQRDREQVELAKLGYLPDVTLGMEWNYLEGRDAFVPPVNPMTGVRPRVNRASEVGDDNWGILLQINLPIWSQRIEAAKREARERLSATQNELRDTENMIAFRIFEAWSRVESQQHTLRVLDSELIPQSRQTYQVTLTAYQAGDSGFVTLIDHWQRWLDFELMRHRETVDLEIAFSDLQRQVGMQLVRDDAAPAPAKGDTSDE